MPLNTNRDSRGPVDPSAYWRRRFFILGGGLALLAVFAWLFGGNGPGPSAAMTAAAHSSMASVKAGDTLPSTAYGSPAAEPSLTTPAMTPPPTSAPASPTAKPTPTRTPASAPAGPSCAPGSIVLSLFTSQASYSQGTRPHFEVYAVSTANTPCELPYGAGSVRVVVTKQGQVVWDSASCGSSAAEPVQFQTGVPHMLTISWNRGAKSPSGCAGSLAKGASGTFDAVAMTAGKSSQVRTFKLLS